MSNNVGKMFHYSMKRLPCSHNDTAMVIKGMKSLPCPDTCRIYQGIRESSFDSIPKDAAHFYDN